MKFSKKYIKKIVREVAKDYVWGVKNPGRVANQYSLKIIKEQEEKLTANQARQQLRDLANNLAGSGIDNEERAFIVNLTQLMVNYSAIKNLSTNVEIRRHINNAVEEMNKSAMAPDQE